MKWKKDQKTSVEKEEVKSSSWDRQNVSVIHEYSLGKYYASSLSQLGNHLSFSKEQHSIILRVNHEDFKFLERQTRLKKYQDNMPLFKGVEILILNFFWILFLFFYQLEANYFTILQWVLSYIEMKQPWVYMCSPSLSPLPPPSPPAPSGSSQCTRSERLSHASHLGW